MICKGKLFVLILRFDKIYSFIASWIDEEKPLKNRKIFSLDQYNLLDDIYAFLDETEQNNPDKVTVITIGESYEGRPLRVLKISTNENNPAIFIESNM